MDAGAQVGDLRHWRVGIVVLNDNGALEIEGKSDGMKVEFADTHRVSRERAVQVGLHALAQRLIDKKRPNHQEHH